MNDKLKAHAWVADAIQLMSDRGITQEWIAAKLFIAQKTVNRWKNGRSYPQKSNLKNFNDLCKELNIFAKD